MKRERIKPVLYEDIKDVFIYDEGSPSGIVWASARCNNAIKAFSVAGCLTQLLNSEGVWVTSVKKKQHKVHRIIYSLVNKIDLTSEDYVIHIDGNTLNNKISNLKKVSIDSTHQLCTKCCQIKPKKLFSKNKAIHGGVSIYCKDCLPNSLKESKYDIDFTRFVQYDETVETKLKRIPRKSLNGITIQSSCGSLSTGCVVINHNKYNIVKVILALHKIFLSGGESIRYKDGNVRNFSISNLEVVEKQKVKIKRKSEKYKDKVSHNLEFKRERRMCRSAKERARKNCLEFSIEYTDIVIPECCPILGFKLEQGVGSVQASSPSLDRIDPNKGYTKDNIQVISYKANTMKNDATVEMLLSFANWVYNEYS